MQARNTARAIVIHEGQILLMERWRKDDNGRVMHYFSIPGGGIEAGETAQEAVIRELFEETQVLIRPHKLVGTTPRIGGGTHNYFVCRYLSGSATLDPQSPEAARQSPTNQHIPCWITKEQFGRIQLHPEYEAMRPTINALL